VLGFDLSADLTFMAVFKKLTGWICNICALLSLFLSVPAHAADQHWLRVSSDHFIVVTDAGEKPGHDVVAHFEQMRAIFGQLLSRSKLRMSEPMEIIAVRGENDYRQLALPVDGKAISSGGFWLSGKDRIFIVLNLSQPDPWRAVEHQVAHYVMRYN
jgi:hypothetical protein